MSLIVNVWLNMCATSSVGLARQTTGGVEKSVRMLLRFFFSLNYWKFSCQTRCTACSVAHSTRHHSNAPSECKFWVLLLRVFPRSFGPHGPQDQEIRGSCTWASCTCGWSTSARQAARPSEPPRATGPFLCESVPLRSVIQHSSTKSCSTGWRIGRLASEVVACKAKFTIHFHFHLHAPRVLV